MRPDQTSRLTRRGFLGASAVLALSACTSRGETGTGHDGAAPSGAGQKAGDVALRLPATKVGFPSPFSYGGGTGYLHAAQLYDTLMWKDAAGQQIPWLATKVERSEDGRRYQVTLREGVTWSDGRPFGAADVAFTFDYLQRHRSRLAPTVISVPAAGVVSSVRAVSPTQVEFVLATPDWTFEKFTGLGGIFIMPQHVWSGVGEPDKQRDPAILVGTGPYRLEQLDVATGVARYAGRPHFLGTPVVSRIDYVPVGDPLNALLAGEVHQAGGVGPGTGLRPQALAPFRDERTFRIIDAAPGQTVTALYFNLARGGVLADARFRRACAHAINRQDLVQRLFDGKGAPGNPGLLPTGNPEHTAVEQYPHDPARAAALLEEAGYRVGPDGVREGPQGRLSLELLTSAEQQQGPVQLIVAALRQVGVEVKPAAVDLTTFGQRRMSGATALSITTFGGTNTDEQPDGLAKVYSSTSRSLQRAQGYAQRDVDAWLAEQRRELRPEKRRELAHRVQRQVATDLPVLPLYYPPLTTIVRTAPFNGWFDTPGGVGGLVPHVNNKLAFITGSGTAPR